MEEHSQFYSKIEPIPENKKKLETIYERYLQLEDTLIKLQQENKGNPPPAPPRPLNPAERIEAGPEKSAPPKPPQKISERNILRVLVNEEGLILMDEEPVPLDKVTAKVKAFITNNGADPDLSESPQKAIIALKTARKTPHKTYTEMMNNIQAAYLEVRNVAAQTEFGVNYQKLVENSPAQTEIQEMYPVRISIADPEQVEDKTKKPPPPQPAKIADRNLLKIWINWEGLILIDQEPTPLDKLAAKVKAFITNNGDNSELSDSPQKAVILFKTDQEISYELYTKILVKVQEAVRGAVTKTGHTINYQTLAEKSQNKGKIQENYPIRISFAEPSSQSPSNADMLD